MNHNDAIRATAELRANLFEMKHNINRLFEWLDNPNDN